MVGKSTSFSSRIGDGALAFGMRLYQEASNPVKRKLWRLEITEYCGGRVLIEADATPAALQSAIKFFKDAQDALASTGPHVSSEDED